MSASEIYILGGDQTDFARNWAREDQEVFDVFKEVFTNALTKAKISPDQIDVAHVGNFVGDLFNGQGLLGGFFAEVYPELAGIPTSRHEAACASGSMAILAAMRDIEAGHYDVAVALGIEQMRNVNGKTGAEYLGAATWKGQEAMNCDFPWPHQFDLLTKEYQKRYGINTDDLKIIGKTNFTNARSNPNAQTRSWALPDEAFCDDDALNPVIEGYVRKLDCGQITDGAACVVLASKKAAQAYAERLGLNLQDIPRIKGWGHRSAPISLASKLAISRNQDYIFPHVAALINDTLKRGGFTQIDDLDGLETHDCFTVTEYMAIDHIGLTPPGESYRAIREGRITMDGDFPINPSGGLIGLGHPVGATGIRMVLDCANQVSGRATCNQIANARNMITLNVGGSTTTCASFIVGRDS
jgi:acetyl-CoA C-acetyltransferase